MWPRNHIRPSCGSSRPRKGARRSARARWSTCDGDYGLVLTNWHVVADATHTIEVLFPDGFRTAARVITTDRTWDLAALAVWRPNVEPVRMPRDRPTGRALDDCRLWIGQVPRHHGQVHAVRGAGHEQAVRDGRAVGRRAARRFRRPDLQ